MCCRGALGIRGEVRRGVRGSPQRLKPLFLTGLAARLKSCRFVGRAPTQSVGRFVTRPLRAARRCGRLGMKAEI